MNSENQIQIYDKRKADVKASLVVACQRVGLELQNIDSTTEDILTEFPQMKIDKMQKAMKNGGLGKYGQTYRFSTQEVFRWIRAYLNPQGENDVDRFYNNIPIG